jgi:succinoglycan biosynthesis transport protein ExoP
MFRRLIGSFCCNSGWHVSCTLHSVLSTTSLFSNPTTVPSHVPSAQFTLQEVSGLIRRRRRILVLPIILITALCIVGAYLLPRKYESSTTILVQRDEEANPLIRFTMLGRFTTEDRLRTFNEIIYSRTTIDALINKLALDKDVKDEADRQGLVKQIQKQITTDQRGPESFRISYSDTDPVLAQQAAALLANLFIETNQRMENQRNELAVDFFEKKLQDFREKYEVSQQARATELQQRITEVPAEDRLLYSKMEDAERKINDVDAQVKIYRQAIASLRAGPEALMSEGGKQVLFNLQYVNLPFIADLHTELNKLEDYSRRYTSKFPDLELQKNKVADLIGRVRSAIEAEITKQLSLRNEYERQRSLVVSDIRRSSVDQQANQDKSSNYAIYQRMYDEMKVKLEEAKTVRDLGRKGQHQFIIIDPAMVPMEPSKPNRLMIIAGGFAVGVLLGIVAAIVAELIDATIRTTRDIEVFQKPIIAFIPEGRPQLME